MNEEWPGRGLVIYRAASFEEALRIAADDPMHIAGARDYTVVPLLFNHLNVQ